MTIPTTEPRDDDPSLLRDACYPQPTPPASPFDSATYYDWKDSESLSCESVEECLERWLDDNYEKGVNVREQIKRDCPIKITAYERKPIEPSDLQSTAESLVEQAQEWFAEEFGDQDNEIPGWNADVDKELAAGFAEVMARVFAAREIESWQCEQVGARTYSAEEVEKILREHEPSLFEEEAP